MISASIKKCKQTGFILIWGHRNFLNTERQGLSISIMLVTYRPIVIYRRKVHNEHGVTAIQRTAER